MTRIGIDPLIGAVVLATVFSLMAAVLIASSVLSAYLQMWLWPSQIDF